MKVEEIKLALDKNRETHVRLALIDDIKAHVQVLKDNEKKLASSYSDMFKFKEKAKDEARALKVLVNVGEQIKGKFTQQSKELGIQPNSINEYTELSKNIDYAIDYLNRINKDIQ